MAKFVRTCMEAIRTYLPVLFVWAARERPVPAARCLVHEDPIVSNVLGITIDIPRGSALPQKELV